MGDNPLMLMDGFRFLRARKFDHVKTKEMLLDAEKWRKEFGVDDIVKCVFFSFLSEKGVTYEFTGTLTSRKKKKWISIIHSITTKPTRFFSFPLISNHFIKTND